MSKKTNILILLIAILSTCLRFGLVLNNRQSNDAHDVVITHIMQTGKLPHKGDCWECFQPKLFHYTSAKILEIPIVEKTRQDTSIAFSVELINLVFGLINLIVIALFIISLPVKIEILKILAFGIVALNPKLIGINSQFTNDTFAILFSTLALYFTFRFHQKSNWISFILTIIFCVLAISSKTNTWVTSIAILISFFIKAWVQRNNGIISVVLGVTFFVSVFTISVINPLNQYIFNYQKYGSPVLLNVKKAPFPDFFHDTVSNRPGILSISDGLFTFKFLDLLRHPIIDNGYDNYSPNRTSLWTQIYGRSQSVHFDNWPSSWAADNEKGFNLTRAIFIFGLIPTLYLLCGFIINLSGVLKSILLRDNDLAITMNYGLFTIAFIGYLLFMIIYALTYRDFAVMKAIFIYPVIIAFPVFYISGVEYIESRIKRNAVLLKGVFITWVVILFGLYVTDIVTMILLIRSRMPG